MFQSLFGRGKSAPRTCNEDSRGTGNERFGEDRGQRRGFSSNEEMLIALHTDGYVLLPDVVDTKTVSEALRCVNCSLGRNVPNRQDMCPDAAKSPIICNLFNRTAVKGIVDQLLSENTSVTEGQIAIRFPGDNTTGSNFQIPKEWENHWHIDGLGDYNVEGRQSFFGDIRNFTVLVGVVLQDTPDDYMGNLVVYPGSHIELQEHFQKKGFDELYRRGVQGLPRLTMRRGWTQIRARAGDVVLLNYCLAHNIAPNTSPQLRYNVYFRITSRLHRKSKKNVDSSTVNSTTGVAMHNMHHYPEGMLNVWHEWPGLRANLPPEALPEASVCSEDSGYDVLAYDEQQQVDLALQRSLLEK